MFAVRFTVCRKHLTNCIYTSSVVKCRNSKNSEGTTNVSKKKEKQKLESEVVDSKKKKMGTSAVQADKLIETDPVKCSIKNNKKVKMESASAGLIGKLLTSSAENVAEHFGGNAEQTKDDLLNYLRTFRISKGNKQRDEASVPERIKSDASLEFLLRNVQGFNIFKKTNLDLKVKQVKLNIWDALEEEELKSISMTAPSNHFEELVDWTNEGRLWHFPIDNDQGLDEEAKVSFTEHIFLEQHLEPWCPKKGPLRKFMELVLVGLAKNPYLSVEEKKEHITWFRDYFENKKKLLQELGAIGEVKGIDASVQKKS